MDIFKKKLKKYFFLLAGFNVGIRTIVVILLFQYPRLLTIQYDEFASRTLSTNLLLYFIELLSNLIFIYLINKDLKQIHQTSIPLLIVTFFSGMTGIILYLIVLFAATYKPTKLIYERHY